MKEHGLVLYHDIKDHHNKLYFMKNENPLTHRIIRSKFM
jgi:hypothetical protein